MRANRAAAQAGVLLLQIGDVLFNAVIAAAYHWFNLPEPH